MELVAKESLAQLTQWEKEAEQHLRQIATESVTLRHHAQSQLQRERANTYGHQGRHRNKLALTSSLPFSLLLVEPALSRTLNECLSHVDERGDAFEGVMMLHVDEKKLAAKTALFAMAEVSFAIGNQPRTRSDPVCHGVVEAVRMSVRANTHPTGPCALLGPVQSSHRVLHPLQLACAHTDERVRAFQRTLRRAAATLHVYDLLPSIARLADQRRQHVDPYVRHLLSLLAQAEFGVALRCRFDVATLSFLQDIRTNQQVTQRQQIAGVGAHGREKNGDGGVAPLGEESEATAESR